MKGSTTRRCGCQDPKTGKKLGTKCPLLRKKGHGSWAVRQELPPTAEGERRYFRRSGCENATSAQAVLDHVRALLSAPAEKDTFARDLVAELLVAVAADKRLPLPDIDRFRGILALSVDEEPEDRNAIAALLRSCVTSGEPLPEVDETARRLSTGQSMTSRITVGDHLDAWLAGKKRVGEGTLRGYRSIVELYLKPFLGHRRLDRLRTTHVADLFDWIEERNETIIEARATGNREQLADLPGLRKCLVGRTTMGRIRDVLRNALNDAIRQQLLTFNAAQWVELPPAEPARPILWNDELVARWRETGERPSPVMVWTREHTGAFLDHVVDHPMYALFHLVATRGLRRGEACGLPWTNVDLEANRLTISQQIVHYGTTVKISSPKSETSTRTVSLGTRNVPVLRTHRVRQKEQKLAWGAAWVDNGLVFTRENGESYHPADLTDEFRALVESAGLPPIRFHDLRHGAAAIHLGSGGNMKEVQVMLGHSTYAFTADVYATLFEEVAAASAEAAEQFIPRANEKTAGHTSGTP
ncbi:tyrosine-type recombinase/integrase [Embleya sp. NPDC059259]|uniref:tyrosine-type recombinase/integrase n=1 Tax=unclassified Embleya TaxID=2699296 RepID=UPI003681998D